MRHAVVSVAFLALLTLVSTSAKGGPAAQNPFQNDESARAAGQKLFQRHCAECHGPSAEGTEKAPSLVRFVRSAEAATLQSFLKNGNLRRGMPSWSRLPDQQLWQLVTYLQSLQD
jgi:mono/diheme cytochrome c family protein